MLFAVCTEHQAEADRKQPGLLRNGWGYIASIPYNYKGINCNNNNTLGNWYLCIAFTVMGAMGNIVCNFPS